MTNNAVNLYTLNLDQIVEAIKACGHIRTVLVQGNIGTGKSSLLNMLSEQLPDHVPCYFDANTKDVGDMMIPKMASIGGEDFVSFAINEELGMHHNKPIILMIDEYGKANPSVKNALLRVMLERKIGSYELHPDSIVFATTNLGAEGVGDLLPAHARNRVTVLTSRKPNNIEWIEWGINNEIDYTLLGWCKENPQLFQSFTDVKDPNENPYIFHPKDPSRTSFVTPRSLHAASDWMKQRDKFSDDTLTALLIGTIGARAAMDLMAFTKLADQLPSLESIKNNPESAKIPDSASAVCMVVFKAISTLERDWVDAWMTYLNRLDKEAQAMFAKNVASPKYSKSSIIMTNKKFTQWARENNYIFSADKG